MKALCVNLGMILQTDLCQGVKMGNYVRVRVALPVYKALETSAAMTAKVKGKKTKMEFDIQYEKPPHICYTCGYLGHQDKSCRRKLK